jgi:hypothetical protein
MANISLDRPLINRALRSVESGLEKYRWIQAAVVERDVAVDAEFQRRFNGFYRIRRNRQWQQVFFGLLEQCKTVPLSFEAVLETLHARTGRVEASFASKLTATIDPGQPVIDRVVLQNVGLRLPHWGAVNRMGRVVQVHDQLQSLYSGFLMTVVGRYLVDQFNARYPGNGITDVKKLDLVLWQTR